MDSTSINTWLLALGVFGVAIAGMAIGVIISNRRLKGSCGGLAGLQDDTGKTACELCTTPSELCSGNPNAPKPEVTEDDEVSADVSED